MGETRGHGRRLAAAIGREGLVIGLEGPLGAGKTEWVRGLAEGLGVPASAVTSPTFVLAQHYPARGGGVLVHADFYRVEDAGEIEAAGLRDWLAPGLVLVAEWSDRFPEVLPRDRVTVRIERDDAARRIGVVAEGPAAHDTVARLTAPAGAAPC